MDDEIDVDNERHRREELERRAKRQKAREKAAAGGGVVAVGEKERKRREHAARILGAQHHHGQQQRSSRSKAKPPSSSGRRGGSSSSSKHVPSSKESSSSIIGGGGSSIFQSLFDERALGFSISFSFRNAPPRPPVGPIFVGLGLEGELQKWTKYKKDGGNNNNNNNSTSSSSYRIMGGGGGGGMGMNAVEKNYHWKLHSDLVLFNGTLHRKVLPGCAMDYEGCYTTSTATNSATSLEDATIGKEIDVGGGVSGGGNGKGMNNNKTSSSAAGTATTTALLPPEDEALIHWKGSLGDTAMELLTTKQDRARAAARLAISQGKSSLLLPPSSSIAVATATTGGSGTGVGGSGGGISSSTTNNNTFRLKKQHHLQSRILDEKIPNFMKKTTYLTNDTTSVHRFTSLASTQVQRAKDMDMAMKEKKENYNIGEMIEKGFREANNGSVTTTAEKKKKKRKRIHPTTKQEVYALWDVPLLPDVKTWGHTFTHVVLDNPPRNITTGTATVSAASSNKKTAKKLPTSGGGSSSSSSSSSSALFKIPQLLNKAIVADVTKHASNARMECTIWVPSTSNSSSSSSSNSTTKTNTAVATTTTTSVVEDGKSPSITATTSSSYSYYSAIQKYDLDVISLRDPSLPPVHHVWTIYLNKEDDRNSYAGYHVIGSRVQLSLGRPVIVGGGGGMGTNTTTTTTTSKVLRRNLKEGEKTELEMKMTLVDVDLAEKYGL